MKREPGMKRDGSTMDRSRPPRDRERPMKTQYYTATSLDGFIADPQNSLDWLLQFGMTDDYPDFIRGVGALAMGSTTYEWIRADLARSDTGRPQIGRASCRERV